MWRRLHTYCQLISASLCASPRGELSFIWLNGRATVLCFSGSAVCARVRLLHHTLQYAMGSHQVNRLAADIPLVLRTERPHCTARQGTTHSGLRSHVGTNQSTAFDARLSDHTWLSRYCRTLTNQRVATVWLTTTAQFPSSQWSTWRSIETTDILQLVLFQKVPLNSVNVS